ncbi:hypothetical protein ENTCAN_05475 [Enterobacter cancerogenus ATCC 35316]|nr:hypothetical protein ENTCAN_05475 [Enterobacter cancerogenus ATCC 35316]
MNVIIKLNTGKYMNTYLGITVTYYGKYSILINRFRGGEPKKLNSFCNF